MPEGWQYLRKQDAFLKDGTIFHENKNRILTWLCQDKIERVSAVFLTRRCGTIKVLTGQLEEKMLRLFIIAGAAGAALIAFMFIRAGRTNICRHEFAVLKEGCSQNLLFISDIHNRAVKEKDLLTGEEIDAVLIGGDLTESGTRTGVIDRNLARLASVGPLYFVWGNNDYQRRKVLQRLFQKYSVTELNNSSVPMGGGCWTLAGIEYRSLQLDSLTKALEKAASPVVLMSHGPDIKEELDSADNIKLVLAGHTHGGQIRLGFYAPAPLGGITVEKGVSILISNGYGTTKLPLRLGAPPQLHFIRLTEKKGAA
ncbi:MAG: metallophosphoesterase [Alkalicoccus sp.]|nr:MAG: metallophosphoesterase [Alkalicoccus sp.]